MPQGFLSLLELAAQRCGDIHFLGQQEKDDVESRAAEVLLASVKVSFGQKSTPHATLQFPNTCFNALRLQSLREHESGLSSSASSKAAASSSGSSEGASSDSSSQPTSSAEGLVPVGTCVWVLVSSKQLCSLLLSSSTSILDGSPSLVEGILTSWSVYFSHCCCVHSLGDGCSHADNFFANSVVRLVQALCLYSAEWRCVMMASPLLVDFLLLFYTSLLFRFLSA